VYGVTGCAASSSLSISSFLTDIIFVEGDGRGGRAETITEASWPVADSTKRHTVNVRHISLWPWMFIVDIRHQPSLYTTIWQACAYPKGKRRRRKKIIFFKSDSRRNAPYSHLRSRYNKSRRKYCDYIGPGTDDLLLLYSRPMLCSASSTFFLLFFWEKCRWHSASAAILIQQNHKYTQFLRYR
jgi:hypothetical protein